MKSVKLPWYRRLARWWRYNFVAARFDTVPFSEVPSGEHFWWRNECYIKENEDIVFIDKPMPRPFEWRERVRVYPPDKES